jgi:hypothetical protein
VFSTQPLFGYFLRCPSPKVSSFHTQIKRHIRNNILIKGVLEGFQKVHVSSLRPFSKVVYIKSLPFFVLRPPTVSLHSWFSYALYTIFLSLLCCSPHSHSFTDSYGTPLTFPGRCDFQLPAHLHHCILGIVVFRVRSRVCEDRKEGSVAAVTSLGSCKAHWVHILKSIEGATPVVKLLVAKCKHNNFVLTSGLWTPESCIQILRNTQTASPLSLFATSRLPSTNTFQCIQQLNIEQARTQDNA